MMKQYWKEFNGNSCWIWETDTETNLSKIIHVSGAAIKIKNGGKCLNLNMRLYARVINTSDTQKIIPITEEEVFIEMV